jgi:hypothetical protein
VRKSELSALKLFVLGTECRRVDEFDRAEKKLRADG